MNNLGDKNFVTRFTSNIKKNYKIYLYIVLSLLILFILFQYYIHNKNKHIMNLSILYNETLTTDLSNKVNEDLKSISKEKNIYGVLSSLEIIKKNLELDNIDDAFDIYIAILERKNLKNYYKNTIAIQGSYAFLNKINLNLHSSNIIDKIYILLSYVDSNLVSFEGFTLELEYLLLTYDQDVKKTLKDDIKINNLYDRIQENDNVSSLIKARIKKIHEFQKYN